MSSDNEQVKEIYARFGLAFYYAQVLEHALVNALVILGLIPSRRHLARSRDEWESFVNDFMGRHFDNPMGRLMASLRSVLPVPPDLEQLLRDALERRNWLAHSFFRERATHFMSPAGREQMLAEVDECRACFESADDHLEKVIEPLRKRAGITDQILEEALRDLLTQNEGDG